MVDIAIVGAASLEAEALVELLQERDFPVGALHLLDSGDALGQSLAFGQRNLRIRDAAAFDFSGVQLVFVAATVADAAVRETLNRLACDVIDLAGALEPGASVCVLPGVREGSVAQMPVPRRVRCPGTVAVALATALAPLTRRATLRRVVVTACLPVSVRGRGGVKELARQTTELLNARPLEPRLFDRQVAFNLLAQAETPDEQGHAPAERRLSGELAELLELPRLSVSATFVQAPVFFGESLSVSLQFEHPVELALLHEALEATQDVELSEAGDYPTAVGDALGQDVICVGRLRSGVADPCEVNLWIVSDNVRKGAALNAVLSGELLIKHYP